ncbi:uncharacterized protein EAE97_009415 [Botrytis byssoidea]|uniref:Ubiquitin-like domain-containing protein n=1 Tax=Botrytis byssoidea TaxID=139641 RepID=A0A9P5LZ79_9HELO|nr:uncharacterized protein EAE97_009415 [Botrytis byssoidea]KAF7929818.1 hypothetical protein EAE97_009415 [Botrytis byssoidea]
MQNSVGPDNRLKVELREPLLDTTGFKQLRVSNVEGDTLDISFRRTILDPESGNRLKVPPDFGPLPIYPVDSYKDKFDRSISTKDGLFIPVYQREAMWINFESNGFFAVKVIVDGVNAVSGELSTESLSKDLRRIALLYKKSSIQEYILAGTLGSKMFGRFEIVPLELDSIKRIQITVQTLSGKVIHINVSLETVVNTLIHKIHGITGIPCDEQRIVFAGHQLQRHHYSTSYGVVAMINAPASEIVLGMKPPSCPISTAVRKEYHCPLLSVHNDDEEKNKDSRDKDEDEKGREVFKVTTDQSGTSDSFAPVGEMKERLREISKLPDDAI